MTNSHGGFRIGAGRKKAEETKVIRVPESKVLDIKAYLKSLKKEGSRLADLHLILPNEVPQLSC
ncbi:hypothetical protein [Acinetobacter variabilis]|uniref:hypothetical protein n=1 Tax=Acinetobacter variabilis TaxID=70346 RepID=UPI003BF4AD0F